MNDKFGYLLIISKSNFHRYDLMAYLLAQTIKRTQASGYDNVAVVSDSEDHGHLFKASPYVDKFIVWKEKNFWDGRSWMDELSPWRYTVCLDVDMMFFRDTSHWIDFFINNSFLYVANKVRSFNDTDLKSINHRYAFTQNSLPMLYSAYTFFDKENEKTKEFFNLQRTIIENPRYFKNMFLSKHKPEVVGTDEAFSLAAKILDLDDKISFDLEFPRFIHLKGELQEGFNQSTITSRDIGYYYSEALKVGNYNITDILHYADKDLDINFLINKYHKEFINKSKVKYG